MEVPAPEFDFHRATWLDHLRLRLYLWRVLREPDIGRRQARAANLWTAWTSRFHCAPPSARLAAIMLARTGF